MKIFKTANNELILLEDNSLYRLPDKEWDSLINKENLPGYLRKIIRDTPSFANADFLAGQSLAAPIGTQEIWAAGVTYFRSKVAREEEGKKGGSSSFYDKVYYAERPELFFKSTANRAVPTNSAVRIRKDSNWNVPEPELTLIINSRSQIVGFTVGNDMSSRSIEGENPLYLPQAKVYRGSASIGPCMLVNEEGVVGKDTVIFMDIIRNGKSVYQGTAKIGQMKRSFYELVEFLFKEMDFPQGVYLMTGTCLVPEDSFTLNKGDKINIEISGIGILENIVE